MTSTREHFTFGLYLTACLASVMLWAAEGAISPAALTIPVAAAAFFYVERRGGELSTAAANGLGVAAIVAALVELWLRDIEGRLLFGAHLLVYLTWILLWLPKATRRRWGLVTLAVLQVGVGSVLTNNGLYGLGMAAFLALTVWTLILLQLDEAKSRHAPAMPPAAGAGQDRFASLLLGRGSVAAAGGAAFGRWPIAQVAAAAGVTVAGALAVGAAFFLLIPRFEVGGRGFDRSDSPLARQRTTGFTETVRLGEFGEILESSVPVFEVRLFDDTDDSPVEVGAHAASFGYDEPLFRGLTLSVYERGEWRSDERRRGDAYDLRADRWPRTGQVRQEYRIQGSDSDVLFAMPPVQAGYVFGAEEGLRIRREARTIARPAGPRYLGELNYVVYSPRKPTAARPAGSFPPLDLGAGRLGGAATGELHVRLPGGLDRTRAVAARVARPDGVDASETVRAERLVRFLRDSGQFSYSLSGAVIEPGVDPVEDFLVNRKAGHCEYFASALALMLRAEGIPCRVASGFKGGEINRLSRAFEVQQRHAHAWVEAYLDGSWVSLDPTPPAARNLSVAENASLLPLLSDLQSAASGFWRNYVVQMNIVRQRRTLAPLREAATAAAGSFRERLWPALKAQAYALATDPGRWISWQGGAATFVLLSFAVAGWRIARFVARRFARARAARDARGVRGRRVEFYERFRRLCERHGWRPAVGQTPREFAARVAGTLAARLLPPRLSQLPGDLTEDFYQVRFGELDLPGPQVRDLESRLGELEAALAADPAGTR